MQGLNKHNFSNCIQVVNEEIIIMNTNHHRGE
jgi:hypothetical protein